LFAFTFLIDIGGDNQVRFFSPDEAVAFRCTDALPLTVCEIIDKDRKGSNNEERA
jgi:hypothetical protein